MGAAFGCVNNTIRLRSGLYFDLADPRPEQFRFADIAGALSKICRFGGQINHYYSVAEHCWHCAMYAAESGHQDALSAVLMHDAAEAFCGDVVKPLKIMLSEYTVIEKRVEAAIAAKFGIDFAGHADAIRTIDRTMLIAERHHFFTADGVTWTGETEVKRIKWRFHGWTPEAAEREFTNLAWQIGVR